MKTIKKTDTVIIGGGFSGLYLAHHLIVGGKCDFLDCCSRHPNGERQVLLQYSLSGGGKTNFIKRIDENRKLWEK